MSLRSVAGMAHKLRLHDIEITPPYGEFYRGVLSFYVWVGGILSKTRQDSQ